MIDLIFDPSYPHGRQIITRTENEVAVDDLEAWHRLRPPRAADNPDFLDGWLTARRDGSSGENPFCAHRQHDRYRLWINGWLAAAGRIAVDEMGEQA